VHFSGVTRAPRIEDGDPANVIEWVAQTESTDLIMMPTKGVGRFRRLLLGSITAKILHDVSCPVWTSAHEPDPGLPAPASYRSILCAVELNPESVVVFKTASLLAQAYGARICLLHVEPSPREHGAQPLAQSVSHAFEKAVSVGGTKIGVEPTVRILDGSVPEGIRRIAIEEAADLVVVGRGHEKGSLSRIWSHLYTIIRESPCPVLSV
jgi:nucleotide-binding universal stress UspA family protein